MDIFDFDNVKVEKANAMLRYRRLRSIAKLFRLVEIFVGLILLSWISTRLPFVVKVLSDYFRQLLTIVVSPLFIFLLGNVIVLTLLAKSGQLTGNSQASASNAGTELYDEIINNENENENDAPVLEPEKIVYQDKKIICEVMNSKSICSDYRDENETEVRTEKPISNSVPDLDPKVYRRSQSENLMKRDHLESEKFNEKLRRSETEIGRRKEITPAEEEPADNFVDKLSNEEFQKRIEGFIARQVRFHQEEKLAIVPHIQV